MLLILTPAQDLQQRSLFIWLWDQLMTAAALTPAAFQGSGSKPSAVSGQTDEQPVLPVPGEVFALRKLMPQQPQYDFNIHVMDFQPGESLYVKVLFLVMLPPLSSRLLRQLCGKHVRKVSLPGTAV